MWILDEAMHNTEHNPKRHWHKTLILAEGKTIEKKDFLMFFISKLNLILIDHKLSALGKKNKGGKNTHWMAMHFWAACFRCQPGKLQKFYCDPTWITTYLCADELFCLLSSVLSFSVGVLHHWPDLLRLLWVDHEKFLLPSQLLYFTHFASCRLWFRSGTALCQNRPRWNFSLSGMQSFQTTNEAVYSAEGL